MFHLRRMLTPIVVLTVLTTSNFTTLAQTQEVPVSVAQENDALIKDAETYASAMSVSYEEALRRLELQADIGNLNSKLTANEGSTFAGLWIQHQPEYRVVVQFTRNGESTIKSYIEKSPLADLIEVRPARATLKQLELARELGARIADKLGITANSGINVAESRAELYVLDLAQFDAGLRGANVQLPNLVSVIQMQKLAENVTDIYGGLAINLCTSGFSVKNSSGTKGITTAGHCPNSQSYSGVDLPFLSGTPDSGGVFDIQWHRGDHAFTVRNLIWDGTYNRYIFSVKFRASQSVGEWVCKYGKTTGYACGTIATTSQDGFNVRVDNMTVQGGDSGGPWFWSNTAYGTTIASCTLGNGTPCAIYGPVDQIYSILGLTILTN